jgi:CDP-diacylglycerol pyrophosphatase
MFKILIISLLIISNLVACQTPNSNKRSDKLWSIINDSCVPNYNTTNNPSPCAEVKYYGTKDLGHVVLKDRVGPLQFLLMPLTKITGIESIELLDPDVPNYFYQAWMARSFMVNKFESSIPEEEISLAINSKLGRSQNQLHIHISCIRTDVKNMVHKNINFFDNVWRAVPGGILGHNYFAIRIKGNELSKLNPFKVLASDFVNAKENMNEFGMALLPIKKSENTFDFILLADRADISNLDYGSVEEIQDHHCPQLYK